MTSPITEGMNPRQIEAITAEPGPVLVVAGPGSGKTRVLTHRIAYLTQAFNLPGYRLMAVTFTNKAANEMKSRVEDLVGERISKQITLGTFHRICTRILRYEAPHTAFTRDFVIFDTQDQMALIRQVLTDFRLDTNKFQPRSVLSAISAAKNELIGPENLQTSDYNTEVIQRVYEAYNARLKQYNARDFDDLLTHTVRLFQQNPEALARNQTRYAYLLVDEFQDTNIAQYELLKLLAQEQHNLFAVGDPDQSIYAFRGADYRNVKRFQEDFSPRMILLEENYRSHQLILDAATAIIRKNPDHIRRDLFSQRKTGPKVVIHEAYNEREEAQYVLDSIETLASSEYRRSDIAVMYRVNSQSRVLEETFVRAGMPYLLVGATRFYARKEIRDVLAYLRLLNNPQERVSFERIINVPARGIGPKTQEQFLAWTDTLPGGIWEGLQTLYRGEESPLSGRARNVLTDFATVFVRLHEMVEDSTPLELLDAILDETGYLAFLEQDRSSQGEDRVYNVGELRRVANEYVDLTLVEFLEEIALVSEVDNLETSRANAVTLLTLHAAKGLEFPVVFLVGLEEGLLPHNRSLEDDNQMAEERRLMYVGLTRAKDHVHLVYTFRRLMWGYHDMNTPSRFLADIPPEITSGGARVPQPSREHPYYQARWETEWVPTRLKREKPETTGKKQATFHKGQRVEHNVFGQGVVVSSKRNYDFEMVNVLFQQHGTKTLDATFLKPLGGDE
ncbi:MAG: UvrD-helicase domain-containing protein [Chloroflexi bacterium]|nr:UvrD-helicase domain-containing protein [Chloroflexota bacterium]